MKVSKKPPPLFHSRIPPLLDGSLRFTSEDQDDLQQRIAPAIFRMAEWREK